MAAKLRKEWPPWWEWEMDPWDHTKERMEERSFTEVDLRRMMEVAKGYKPAKRPGRWIIETKFKGKPWNVIVKPDYDAKTLEVVTSYQVTRRQK